SSSPTPISRSTAASAGRPSTRSSPSSSCGAFRRTDRSTRRPGRRSSRATWWSPPVPRRRVRARAPTARRALPAARSPRPTRAPHRQYLSGGSVDQGVDYAAPGGTPLYAVGDGVVIQEGIPGFGPNAIVLKITSGPLAGRIIYYGHSGGDLVRVGDHVRAGQQISIVGYGIVGISTGPHLEIGFWPLGNFGAGSSMLSVINGLLGHGSHAAGLYWSSQTPPPSTQPTPSDPATTSSGAPAGDSAGGGGASPAPTASGGDPSATTSDPGAAGTDTSAGPSVDTGSSGDPSV